MAVFRLNDKLWFPNPLLGEDDGLIAVGGDLSVPRLCLAYSYGFFPWYSYKDNKSPHWYCPLDRFVIFPADIHVSHSMRQLLRRQQYDWTLDGAFSEVIRGCSEVNGRNRQVGAWLGPDIIEAWTRLFQKGVAHSIEIWERPDGNASARLVGGLYGIYLHGAFFGESMFSLVPSASKLALIHLARFLQSRDAVFIDCQFETPHLLSMGGTHISYARYMQLLIRKSRDMGEQFYPDDIEATLTAESGADGE